jgi:hypothetical protein
MPDPIGYRRWAIAEGHHDATADGTACILNASDDDAHVALTVFFTDREPAGPYGVTVPARRTVHLRFDDLSEPESIPTGADYASVIESDVPVVVQWSRIDASTIAYAGD